MPDRGALVGAMISSIFGVVWTEWAVSGMSGTVGGVVEVAGLLVGLVSFFWSARLLSSAPRASSSSLIAPPRGGSRSMFSSPRYLLVVAIEVAAIGGGNKLLGATGHTDYVIVWAAIVVGIHFVAFGRLFFAGFYWVGAALIAAGIAGAVVGFAGGGAGGIKATTGVMAAASLFAASGWTVAGARARA